MPVKASCSDCGAAFAAAEHLYGKRVRCPSCGGAVDVPNPATSQPATSQRAARAPVAPISKSAESDDPLAGDFSGAMQMQPQSMSASNRRHVEEKLDSNDYRVIIYAVLGAGGILLLLVAAILLTKFFSDDSPTVAAVPNVVTESGDNQTSTNDSRQPPANAPAAEDTPSEQPMPAVDIEQEKLAVRTAFDAYKKAIASKQGEQAADLVDSATLNYYQQMLDAALTSKEEAVRAMSPTDKINVLIFRHMIPQQQLKEMDGRAVFSHSVGQGWTGTQAGQAQMGEVTVTGDNASAPVMAQGRPSNLSFSFTKEQGKWRMNLLAQLTVANELLKSMAAESGQDENAMVLQMLTVISGKPPTDEIWKPLVN